MKSTSANEKSEKPPLKPLPKSLLLPALSLIAHANENRRPQCIVSDATAEAWFNALSTAYSEIPNPPDELMTGIITRSMIIDYAVLGFVAVHRRVSVVDLGSGFSTRFKRLGLNACSIDTWVHVDTPEVLQLRCSFEPMSGLELAVGRDLCNLDPASLFFWAKNTFVANLLFICEGVLNHLPKDKAEVLIQLLHKRYQGETIIGTVMTTRALNGLQSLQEALGTPFPAWGVQSHSELERWLKPARIQRCWQLGKIIGRLGLIRPESSKDASGLVFQAQL